MIQNNLKSLQSYSFESILLPAKVAKTIDIANRNFFCWNANFRSPSINIICCNKIYTPKQFSGLELRKLPCPNRDVLTKWAWKIHTDPNNIWVKLVIDKYHKHQNFMSYKVTPYDSLIWKNILKQRDIIRKGNRWKIGNVGIKIFGLIIGLTMFPLLAC